MAKNINMTPISPATNARLLELWCAAQGAKAVAEAALAQAQAIANRYNDAIAANCEALGLPPGVQPQVNFTMSMLVYETEDAPAPTDEPQEEPADVTEG